MPFIQQAQTNSCPSCGLHGPYNFRVESWVSVRPPENGRYDEAEESRVLVCRKCGHVLGDPVPVVSTKRNKKT